MGHNGHGINLGYLSVLHMQSLKNKMKNGWLSEMARIENKNGFQTSEMAAGGHFKFVLKINEKNAFI